MTFKKFNLGVPIILRIRLPLSTYFSVKFKIRYSYMYLKNISTLRYIPMRTKTYPHKNLNTKVYRGITHNNPKAEIAQTDG